MNFFSKGEDVLADFEGTFPTMWDTIMTDLSQMCDTLGYPAFVPKISGQIFLHNQRVGKVVPVGSFFPKHFLYCQFTMTGIDITLLARQPELQ